MKNPLITSKSEIKIEKKSVCLKLLANCMAVITGITIKAPINRTPIIRIESTTVSDAKRTIIKFINLIQIPLALANSSFREVKNNSL